MLLKSMSRNVASIIRVYSKRNLDRYFSLFIFIFAFLLRFGVILVMDTYTSPYHYSEHVHIAKNILAGKGYSHDWYGLGAAGEGSFMPPVYTGLIVEANLAFPNAPWLALQVFQGLLSACTVVLVYFIGKEIFSELVGVLASLLAAVYPPLLGYVLDIQSLIVEAFLVTFVVFTAIYWRKFGTWKHAALLGFALGLAILSRSNLILLLPLLFIWMVLNHRRQGIIHFIIAVGLLVLILGPWALRNYLIYERFVFVSTNGGFTMFQGNNPMATGVAYPRQGDVLKQYPQLARDLVPLDEAARDERLFQESKAFIQSNPHKAIELALKKFVYFWWFKPGYIQGGVGAGYPWYFGLIYMGSYTILLGLAVLGLALSGKVYKELFIVYVIFLIQTGVAMVFLAGTRHRGILEYLLIVLAAYGVTRVLPRLLRILNQCLGSYLGSTKVSAAQ